MQKFMAGLSIEIVSPLYNETKDRLPTLPMPMKQAIQSALDREPDPKAKALQPSDVADIGFLQEIEKSGFLRELDKSVTPRSGRRPALLRAMRKKVSPSEPYCVTPTIFPRRTPPTVYWRARSKNPLSSNFLHRLMSAMSSGLSSAALGFNPCCAISFKTDAMPARLGQGLRGKDSVIV